jgi:hypothetical protein
MLPETRRLALRTAGVTEQTAALFEPAQKLEEVEYFRQRRGLG